MLRKQAKYPCYISEQVHIRSNGDSSSNNSSTENRALFDAHAMYKRQVTTLLCCVLVYHGPHCPGLLLKIKDRQLFHASCCFCIDKGELLLFRVFHWSQYRTAREPGHHILSRAVFVTKLNSSCSWSRWVLRLKSLLHVHLVKIFIISTKTYITYLKVGIYQSEWTLMSRAKVKKASSTLMEALADVSMNLIPYSMASCSPLSLDTC